MSFEVQPSHVLAVLLAIGGGLFGILWKINRCVGRHEGEIKGMKERFETFVKSYLDHLDKKDR